MKRFLVLLFLIVTAWIPAETLHDLAVQTGARVFWEPYRDVVLFSDPRHRLAVDLASGFALGDGESVFDLAGLDPVTGTMAAGDYQRLLAWWKDQPIPTKTPAPEPAKTPRVPGAGPRIQVLVLDAGHGGSDPGSIGRHTIDGKEVVLQEKDLTLAVVLELQKLLIDQYPDRTIILTRKSDTYPTLEKRVQIAHAQNILSSYSLAGSVAASTTSYDYRYTKHTISAGGRGGRTSTYYSWDPHIDESTPLGLPLLFGSVQGVSATGAFYGPTYSATANAF